MFVPNSPLIACLRILKQHVNALSKQLSRFRGKMLITRTHNDAGAKQNYAPTLADLYAVASLDSVLYAIHEYFAKFLRRCARKCTI